MRRICRLHLSSAALPITLMLGAAAQAEPAAASAHCRAVRAEARSTSSLLYAPRLEAQALRIPRTGDLELGGPASDAQQQVRAAVAYSVVDAVRGRAVVATAEADCERQVAREALEEVLRHGSSYGRAEALRRQVASLEASLPRAAELVKDAEQRLERQLASVMELDQVWLRSARLQRRLAEARHELGMLEAQGFGHTPQAPLTALVTRYETAAGAIERERSVLRRLSAWQLDLRAGAVPLPRPDWFGMVTMSWNLGHVRQGGAEREARSAREEALHTSSTELRAQAERFLAGLRESAAHLREELGDLEAQLARYARRSERAPPQSVDLRPAEAISELDRLELEAQRAFVQRLLEQRDLTNLNRETP